MNPDKDSQLQSNQTGVTYAPNQSIPGDSLESYAGSTGSTTNSMGVRSGYVPIASSPTHIQNDSDQADLTSTGLLQKFGKDSKEFISKNRKLLLLAIILLLIAVVVIGLALMLNRPSKQSESVGTAVVGGNLELEDGPGKALALSRKVDINGQLRINNSVIITPSETPANPQMGQLYVNEINGHLYYFDGTKTIDLSDPLLGIDFTSFLNASNLTVGTLSDARLSQNVTVQGNDFNGANQLLQLNGSGLVDTSLLTDNVALLDRNSQTFSGNSQVFRNSANSTTAFRVQNASGGNVLVADTSNTRIAIGQASANYTLDVNGDINIASASAYKIGGVDVCTSLGCIVASSAGILNQNSIDQTADFRISGTGRANTSIQTPLIDTPSATALNIGTTNATAINLNQNTTVASNKSFTANGTALFQSATNSATAFQIQNTAGSNLLQVNTTTPNIITNSSFEAGTSGWVPYGTATIAQETNNNNPYAYIGASDLRVTLNGVGDGAQYNLGSLSPSTSYYLTFAAHSDYSDLVLSFGYNEGGGDIDCMIDQYQGPWTQYYCVFATGPTVTSPYIYIKSDAGAGMHLWIDNVQLINLSANNAFDYQLGEIQLNGVITSPVIFRNNGYAVNAFQVQDQSGNSYINVDQGLNSEVNLLNNSLRVGSTLITANSDLLIQNATNGESLYVDNTYKQIRIANGWSGDLIIWNSGSSAVGTEPASVVANGYIYVLGGATAAAQYAPIYANGATGTWTNTSNFPTSSGQQQAAVAYNNYIYVIGYNGGTSTYYARINSDGSLGTWQSTSAPGTGSHNFTAAVYNGYVYAAAAGTAVYYAKINANGSLGTWTSTAMTAGNRPQIVVANNKLYQFSGSVTNTVTYADISPSGGLSGVTTGPSLPMSAYKSRAVVMDGYMYVFSDDLSNTALYYAQIQSDGTISGWNQSTNFQNDIGYQNTVVAYNGYVYANGGSYYSVNRTNLSGALDLVGHIQQSLSDGGASGAGSSLTAGNTNIIGALNVAGQVNLSQNLGVGGDLNVAGQAVFQGANSTNAFQVQNSTANSLLSVDTATTPNLITNPSFEINTDGWAARSTATLTRITSQQYIGNASLQATTTAAANNGVKYNYSLASSTNYTLSFYAKASTNTFGTMQVGRTDNGTTGGETNCLTGQVATTSVWTRFTCTFTTGTTSGTPYIYIKQSDATARTFYIDGVQLEASSSATNFSLGRVSIDGIINSHLMLQNSVDATNSLQIQNASGTNTLLNVDTSTLQLSLARSVFAGNLLPSTNASISATSLSSISVDTTNSVGQYNSIAIGTDGLPIVSAYDATNTDLRVTKCNNANCSSTSTSVDVGGGVGQYTSIIIGRDGLPTISYYDSTNQDLKVIKCGNTSCSSGNTTTTLDSTGTVGQYTSIIIGRDGLPTISYYDTTNTDLKVIKCGNTSCSSGNTTTSVDTTGTVGQYNSIAIGTDGLPVISYLDTTNTDLKVIKCGNTSCSSGNTTTSVDTTGSVGSHSAITIGTDGLPVISYYDSTNQDLKVIKCGNTSCSSGNTTTTLDSTGTVGQYTSIIIGRDGLPTISYYDTTNTDLKVIKCGNTSCSSGNTTTSVDTTGSVGSHSAITIGTDGLPVISYYDSTNQDLKVIKCGNTSCSSGNTTTTLDSTGSVGTFSSIKIGNDGLPVISYYDATNLDLKVTRCGNTSCSGSGNTLTGGVELGSANTSFQNAYINRISTIDAVNPFTIATNGVDRLTVDGAGQSVFKANSLSAFQIQNAAGTGNLLIADTINNRIAIGQASANYKLDVNGDINITSGNSYRINGTSICTSSGCVVDATSGIKNQTTSQSNANFNIQSAGDSSITGVIQSRASQTADLLQFQNSSGVKLSGIGPEGSLRANATATGTTDTTSGTGTNTTTLTIVGTAFSNGDVILIDNAGQDYYTRVTAGGGTSSLTVSPAITFETGRTVTKYNIQNIGASSTDYSTQADRFFQGYFLGGVVTGAGSTTLSDGRLASTTNMNFNSSSYIFQNTSNSSTAFQLQNTSGTNLFSADTTNMRLSVGGSGTATGQLYISGTVPTASTGSVLAGDGAGTVFVQDNYAYTVATNTARLYITDVSNPSSPVAKGNVLSSSGSLYDIYVQGRYAYGVDPALGSIVIFDVSNPVSPTEVSNVNVATDLGETVYVQGRYAYVASPSDQTFIVVDISNPSSPKVASTEAMASLISPREIQVQGRYAYVLDYSNSRFDVIDISNPADPVLKGNRATSGLPYSFAVQGRYAYVVNASASTDGLRIYDISDPDNPSAVVGTVTMGNVDPQSIYVQGRYAYVVAFSGGFRIFDISNPTSPSAVGNVSSGLSVPYSVYVQGRYAYVADANLDSLVIYDIGGSYVQQLESGGIETGTLNSRGNAYVGGNLSLQGGLSAGSAQFNGNIGVSGQVSYQNTTNSTAAFQIQNAVGEQLIKVDTSTTYNLLTNGNFEANTNGWVAKGSATISQTTSQQHLGNGSMQLVTTATANDGARYDYALTSQTNYTITFFAKSSITSSAVSTISIGRSEDGSTDSDCATGQTINGAGWTKVTCTFATANVSGSTYIYIKQSDATARTMYIDSVQLQTSTNQASNSDLEVNASGWGGYNLGAWAQTSSQSYTGSGSLQVDTSAMGSTDGVTFTISPAVLPSTTYTANVWVKLDVGTPGSLAVSLLKRLDNVDSASGTTCASKILAPDVWTNISCTFTTASLTNVSPFFAIVTTDDGITPITFYVDTVNFSITKWNTNDLGRISLNGAIDSPITVRGLQNSTSALVVQQADGANTLTVDTVNNRVGIGTASPTATLSVTGSQTLQFSNSNDTLQVLTSGNLTALSVNNSRATTVGANSGSSNASLSVYGISLVKTMANSTSAFRVQNSSNVNIFGVDTSNSRLFSGIADGASAVGFTLNTSNTYSTSGAKLLSILNNTIEKFSIDKDGNTSVGGSAISGTGALALESGGTGTLSIGTNATDHSINVGSTTGASRLTLQAGSDGIYANHKLHVGNTSDSASTPQNYVRVASDYSGYTSGYLQSYYDNVFLMKNAYLVNNGGSGYRYEKTGVAAGIQLDAGGGFNVINVGSGSAGASITPVTTLGIDNTGKATFKNRTDSTTAFQIQNAGGTTILGVDTSSGILFSSIADGASAVGFTLRTSSAYSTAGAKILSVQNSTSEVFAIDKDGHIASYGHFKSTQTTVPTIGTPTNCGTTPTSAVTASSTDSAGSFTITTGTGALGAGTCDTIITFNRAYGTAPKSVIITPKSGVSTNKTIYVSGTSTTTFTVMFGTPATLNSEANDYYYWVVE